MLVSFFHGRASVNLNDIMGDGVVALFLSNALIIFSGRSGLPVQLQLPRGTRTEELA
jgi:hypothetical protein